MDLKNSVTVANPEIVRTRTIRDPSAQEMDELYHLAVHGFHSRPAFEHHFRLWLDRLNPALAEPAPPAAPETQPG